MPNLIKLPIDELIPRIQESVRAGKDIILKASPGSGKTTRVPPALMESLPGEIWVLEPRRIAARMSAIRVAEELGQKPGELIGWQMRFDSVTSDQTRVLFLTEGMFTARLAQNADLSGVSCVILDEFHERHQQTDVAFSLLRQLQSTNRPDLRIIVMSATLDTMTLVEAMPHAELIEVDIPLHPVRVDYWDGDYNEPLVERCVKGIQKLATDETHNGHILVFLPGTAEIVRVKTMLQRKLPTEGWLILELRGSLDKATQDLAFKNTQERKIILATNIAESSITIPGVTGVVDSGLARVVSFNLFSGLSTLETKPVARASIIQRTGRAGRTGPGIALRLFTKHDEASRPEIDTPEILRLDLAPIYLSMLSIAHQTKSTMKPENLPWLSSPETKAWDDAKKLLRLLNFTNETGGLFKPDMALLPVHPRVARFAAACVEAGLRNEAPWLTALLATPEEVSRPEGDNSHLGCDLLARYESLRAKQHLYGNVVRAAQQIARLLRGGKLTPIETCRPPHELHLAHPLLKAFPDRVMLIRNKGAKANWLDATLCTGGDLRVSKDSAAAHGDWVIALDASSSRIAGSVAALGSGHASTAQITVTMASQIELTDLTEGNSGLLVTDDVSEWDEKLGKSRVLRKTKYGVLVISSIVQNQANARDSSSVAPAKEELARQIIKQWPKPFESSEDFDAYIIRQQLAYDAKLVEHVWEKNELLELLVAQICDEAASFDEIEAKPLLEWLRYCVGEDEFSHLQKVAPSVISVGAGHKVKVHYSENSTPWIAARLQNFFGQAASPKIMEGRVPLTLHLLAPNMRALQVTTDLAGFWQRAYPALRNEYLRKYPRHYWPEDPMKAEPPPMRLPRKPR